MLSSRTRRSYEFQVMVKWSRTLWPLYPPPHPMSSVCLLLNFSQRISLIREVRKQSKVVKLDKAITV